MAILLTFETTLRSRNNGSHVSSFIGDLDSVWQGSFGESQAYGVRTYKAPRAFVKSFEFSAGINILVSQVANNLILEHMSKVVVRHHSSAGVAVEWNDHFSGHIMDGPLLRECSCLCFSMNFNSKAAIPQFLTVMITPQGMVEDFLN